MVQARDAPKVHLFERAVGGKYGPAVTVTGLEDPTVRDQLDAGT